LHKLLNSWFFSHAFKKRLYEDAHDVFILET
jgi:hypothetical protein